jgi:hypothetical protein
MSFTQDNQASTQTKVYVRISDSAMRQIDAGFIARECRLSFTALGWGDRHIAPAGLHPKIINQRAGGNRKSAVRQSDTGKALEKN